MKRILFLTILIICVCSYGVFSKTDTVHEFLKGYGWECAPTAIESEKIIIPDPFDMVYENYNKLQLEAGLDLAPYAGKKCTRYTYEVTNYPEQIDEPVRANVIVFNGKCIGGDICTVSLYGFIHSLNFP